MAGDNKNAAVSAQSSSSVNNMSIQQPPPMPDFGNIADNWRDWRRIFEWFLIAAGREQAPDKEKCALFLHVIGKCGREIYEELDFKDGEQNNYLTLCNKFDARCDPTKTLILKDMYFSRSLKEPNRLINSLHR